MTADKQELWDVVDKSGKVLGQMHRGQPTPKGLYHVTVEIVATDGAGYLLLTRRALDKKYEPGYMEFPAGSVISGEQPKEAAVRELREETGLEAGALIPVNVARTPGLIRITYVTVVPGLREKKIVLQPSETIGYEFATLEEFWERVIDGSYCPSRGKTYGPVCFEALRKHVGEAPQKKPLEKEPEPPRNVKITKTTSFRLGSTERELK